jgi:hypothetical protein
MKMPKEEKMIETQIAKKAKNEDVRYNDKVKTW